MYPLQRVQFEKIDQKSVNPHFSPSPALQQFLSGKALLLDELKEFVSLLGIHYENGYIGYKEAISIRKGKLYCNRCGTTEPYHFYNYQCAKCNQICTYCRNCIMMGKMQSCAKLVVWTGTIHPFPSQQHPLHWKGKLSEGQKTASDMVMETIRAKETCLVWAVCGAGKTEVLFEGIAVSIAKGERVCIATPRTDVVLELAPRLKKVFPTISIAALYGGSEEKKVYAQLIISTTHQLLRYERAFDTIIVDEVDAFPYSMDKSLQFAVAKSLKEISSLIFLTATPSPQLQKAAFSQKLKYVTIPARYHRHPIPIPQFKWIGNWKKSFSKNVIPYVLHQWFKQKLQDKTPFLIFFPNIELMNKHLPLFQKEYSTLEAVHAEDPDRKAKVQRLRNEQTLGLLTTTILERGVTISKLHVAVVGAEEDIFTESALVQIAGRVGRSADCPTGEVIFFHYGRTRAMIQAMKQIKSMNGEARKKGLIYDV